jgi:large subunit ribosomal protein L16
MDPWGLKSGFAAAVSGFRRGNMMVPKRTKYRRQHRGHKCYRGQSSISTALSVEFGSHGIQALESGWITSRQIESCRRSITRRVRRKGKLWIRIFPDKPVTERAAESRMGSGKGSVSYYVSLVKIGSILFEISGLPRDRALGALKLACYKLPVRARAVSKESALTRKEIEGILRN